MAFSLRETLKCFKIGLTGETEKGETAVIFCAGEGLGRPRRE